MRPFYYRFRKQGVSDFIVALLILLALAAGLALIGLLIYITFG